MMDSHSASLNEETVAHIVAALRRRGGDSTTVEVKSAREGTPELGPTLSAFANMPEGGALILGLDERNGFVPVGLTDIATLEQGIAGQARDAVIPPVSCSFSTIEFEGAPLLIVTIEGAPLEHRPVYFGKDAYLRQSDGDYRMSDLEIAQIELMKTQLLHPTRPDLDPVPGTSQASFADDLVDPYVEAVRRRSRRLSHADTRDVLINTGVLCSDGEATLAGLYALGSHPQGRRPALGITAAVQIPRGGATRNKDLAHFTGPIPDLLDDVMRWIARNTPTDMGYDDRGRGRDFTALPMQAVRELVANALVHRNLDGITDNKHIEIRIRDDKLIITSPGGLRGVSLDQLGKPNGKSAVNPTLYDICKDLRATDGARIIEGEGGGIKEVREAVAEYGLPEPIFRDSGLAFTAILYWRPSAERHVDVGIHIDPAGSPRKDPILSPANIDSQATATSKNADKIWPLLGDEQSLASLVELSGLSVTQVRWVLRKLIDAGYVQMLGKQGEKTTRYGRATPTP